MNIRQPQNHQSTVYYLPRHLQPNRLKQVAHWKKINDKLCPDHLIG